MLFCWTGMLPIAIAFTILVPSLLIAFDYVPFGV
jgi:NADH-ubiquinone oxidoreductase chain 1